MHPLSCLLASFVAPARMQSLSPAPLTGNPRVRVGQQCAQLHAPTLPRAGLLRWCPACRMIYNHLEVIGSMLAIGVRGCFQKPAAC